MNSKCKVTGIKAVTHSMENLNFCVNCRYIRLHESVILLLFKKLKF